MKKFAKISFIFLSIFLIFALLLTGGFFLYINTAKNNVTFDKKMLEASNTSIDIFDEDLNKINAENGKKALVKFEELPSYVPASFVSIEDKNFYTHNGLNYKRIVKAFFNNLKTHSLREGASTISQQLIKNTHLSSEKTITRKINEMALARELEKNFSKNEILETYLNVIYFGSGAYGLENASKTYFGKTASELSLEESALLAGMIKSPKTYSPIYNYESAIKRRNLVLSEMEKDGVITKQDYEKAKNTPILLNEKISKSATKNLYEEATLLEAEKILGLTENEIALSRYKIFTYQDNADQKALRNTINDSDYYAKNEYGNIADSCGVIINNNNGGICAFDGKSIYDLIGMKRSPGSSIKPILVYAPALENGKISPSTMIDDSSTKFGNYFPQNVGGIYYGWIDATTSVEKSLNIPAIKIMEATGIENCKSMAKKCGIEFSENEGLAIALGGLSKGTNVVQLVNTYIPFSNGGNFIAAKFIKKICDSNGNVVYQNLESRKKVMSEETGYLMTEMLKSGVKKGTSSRLNSLPFSVAGKTGTVGIKGTNYNSDVWSVAYTPQKTVGIWLGDSTGEKEYLLDGKNNGGTYCTSIVRDTLKNMNIDKTKEFSKPNNIIDCKLDLLSLEKEHTILLADKETPDRYTKTAIFNKKFAPTLVAKKYERQNVCSLNGKLIGGKPEIEFLAIKDASYKLFRIEEDERKLVKTFENVCGTQTYIDENVNQDTNYTYYIELSISGEKNIVKSNSISIFVIQPKNTIKKIFENW